MNVLIIGYGSIGSRHARLLSELGNKVSILSKHETDFNKSYKSIAQALESEKPDYIVIANKTGEHYPAFVELANYDYQGVVLVEKPLFHRLTDIPDNNFKKIFVAYNLRFHPIIQKLKELLQDEKIISVNVYAGQYLPDWRPGTDYRLSYSSQKKYGGGVLRDLSHELDYLNWLFAGWTSLTALGGHYSELEIDSNDIFNILMTTNLAPIVNVQLNYLDRTTRREIIINTDSFTVKADLISNTLQINNEIKEYNVNRDQTYINLHKAVLADNTQYLCSLDEGLEVLRLIEAAELSIQKRMWIAR